MIPIDSVLPPRPMQKKWAISTAGTLPRGWLGQLLGLGLATRGQQINDCLRAETFGIDPFLSCCTIFPSIIVGHGNSQWLHQDLTETDRERLWRDLRAGGTGAVAAFLQQKIAPMSRGWVWSSPGPRLIPLIATVLQTEAERNRDDDGCRWLLWCGEVARFNAAVHGIVPIQAPAFWGKALGTWGMPHAGRLDLAPYVTPPLSLPKPNPELFRYQVMAPPLWRSRRDLENVLRYLAAECSAPGWRTLPRNRGIDPTRPRPLYRPTPALGSLLWPEESDAYEIDAALMREERAAEFRRLLPYLSAGVSAIQVIVTAIGSYAGGAAGPALGAAVGAAGGALIQAGSSVLTSSLMRVFRGLVMNPSGGIDWGGVVEGAIDGVVQLAGSDGFGGLPESFERFTQSEYESILKDTVSSLDRDWGYGLETVGAMVSTSELSREIFSR